MRVTIVGADTAVYTEHGVYEIPAITALIPEGVANLHFQDGRGFIEYKLDIDWNKPNNTIITELPEWAVACRAMWDEQHNIEQVQQKAQQEAQEKAPIILSTGTQSF